MLLHYTIKTAASYLIVKDIQIDKNNYKQCFNTFFQNSFKTCLPPALGSETPPPAPFPRNIFAVWVHASSTSSDERASGLTCVASLNLLFTSREKKISIDLQIVVPSS